MSYLPSSKWGNCTQCPSKNVACVKIGKELVCIQCNNNKKVKSQIKKANDRDRLRRGEVTKSISQKSKDLTKSELLKTADRVFGDYIKNRDADSDGKIQCPCCCKFFNLEDVDKEGNKIVQPLHFVSRKIYNHRFNEQQVFSGDCYCNLDMHLYSKGKAYQGYRTFMVNFLGEAEVAELEIAHRKINMIEAKQLKNIIEHYSNPS